MQPFPGVDGFDFLRCDDCRASAVGIYALLCAVMRPLEFHASERIELLQQVLNERANGIDSAVLRMQTDAVGFRLGVEGPVFHLLANALRDVFWQWIILPRVAHDLCELKRVLLCSFIRQRNDEAEVGEVISHVFCW